MKEADRLNKEIEVLYSMINVLNRCLTIYYKEKEIEAMKNTLQDLGKCKKELKRLILAKEAAREAATY